MMEFLRWWYGREVKRQVRFPLSESKEVLSEIHVGFPEGYFGVTKTLETMRQRFHWVGFHADLKNCSK